jgi:hypothetical protein
MKHQKHELESITKGRVHVSSRDIVCLLKTSKYVRTLFRAVAGLAKGQSLETFLRLKVQKCLICLAGPWNSVGSITDWKLILFFRKLTTYEGK